VVEKYIKAIETRYNGYRFRSRTEARWAVFFDTIGFKWQYEEEGYELENGRRYLPDFKLVLPSSEIHYIEVKPEQFDSLDDIQISDYRVFSKTIGSSLTILTGQPSYNAYNMIRPEFEIPGNDDLLASFSLCYFQDYEPYIKSVDEEHAELVKLDRNTGHWALDVDDRDAKNQFGRKYVEAVQAAKSARF
jgi:hypothetical protein